MSDFEADFDGAALAEAWRAHRREGLRHLVVTGRDGATLGTYAGDGAADAAPPPSCECEWQSHHRHRRRASQTSSNKKR